MTLKLYAHPFSSYCQKAKTAFYEKGVAFEEVMLDGSEPAANEFAALWPIGRFPLLTDGNDENDRRVVFETTTIIEYLDAKYPDKPLIPGDPITAVEARMWDRFFDNYVSYPQQRLVYGALGREAKDDARWHGALDTAYAVLDKHLAGREWAAGDAFSLADCAAAPALLYADWSHAIPKSFANVWAYRDRLLARPSYARALDEARPYRHYFPLGAPEGRD